MKNEIVRIKNDLIPVPKVAIQTIGDKDHLDRWFVWEEFSTGKVLNNTDDVDYLIEFWTPHGSVEKAYYSHIVEIQGKKCIYVALCELAFFSYEEDKKHSIRLVGDFIVTPDHELYIGIKENSDTKEFKSLGTAYMPVIVMTPIVDMHQFQYKCLSKTRIYEHLSEAFGEIAILSGYKFHTWNSENEDLNILSQWLHTFYYKEEDENTSTEIKELLSYPLPEVKLPTDEVAGIVQKVFDGMCVIRTFCKGIEGARIYVSKDSVKSLGKYYDGYHYLGCNSDGRWGDIPLVSYEGNDVFKFDAMKGTLLEYKKELISLTHDNPTVQTLWLFAKVPCIEQIYKFSDLGKAAVEKWIQKSLQYNMMNCIWSMLQPYWGFINDFGYTNVDIKIDNQVPLHQVFGVSHYIMKKFLNDSCKYYIEDRHEIIDDTSDMTIAHVKSILGNNLLDISDNDILKVKEAGKKFLKDRHKFHMFKISMKKAIETYGLREGIDLIPYIQTLIPITVEQSTIFNGVSYREIINAISLFNDYCIMVDEVEGQQQFKAKFKTFEEVKAAHDMLQDIVNVRKSKTIIEQWEEQTEKWTQWEFSTKSYSVIAPKFPNEIAEEGIALHHCVKGFLKRVAEGKTNILFIRKQEQLAKPFFTVEISNDGVVEQIHGFANRNVETEPDLIPFIEEWFKAKKLKNGGYNHCRG